MVENRRNLRMWSFCLMTMLLQFCADITLPCKLADEPTGIADRRLLGFAQAPHASPLSDPEKQEDKREQAEEHEPDRRDRVSSRGRVQVCEPLEKHEQRNQATKRTQQPRGILLCLFNRGTSCSSFTALPCQEPL